MPPIPYLQGVPRNQNLGFEQLNSPYSLAYGDDYNPQYLQDAVDAAGEYTPGAQYRLFNPDMSSISVTTDRLQYIQDLYDRFAKGQKVEKAPVEEGRYRLYNFSDYDPNTGEVSVNKNNPAEFDQNRLDKDGVIFNKVNWGLDKLSRGFNYITPSNYVGSAIQVANGDIPLSDYLDNVAKGNQGIFESEAIKKYAEEHPWVNASLHAGQTVLDLYGQGKGINLFLNTANKIGKGVNAAIDTAKQAVGGFSKGVKRAAMRNILKQEVAAGNMTEEEAIIYARQNNIPLDEEFLAQRSAEATKQLPQSTSDEDLIRAAESFQDPNIVVDEVLKNYAPRTLGSKIALEVYRRNPTKKNLELVQRLAVLEGRAEAVNFIRAIDPNRKVFPKGTPKVTTYKGNLPVDVGKTNSPNGKIDNVGGVYDPRTNTILVRLSNTAQRNLSTAFHETLHAAKYGQVPENEELIINISDPEVVKTLSERSKRYFLSAHEAPVHYRQLGIDLGIPYNAPYPGDAEFEKIVNRRYGAAFYANFTPENYGNIWKALNGTYFKGFPSYYLDTTTDRLPFYMKDGNWDFSNVSADITKGKQDFINEITSPEYRERAEQLRKEAEKQGLLYTPTYEKLGFQRLVNNGVQVKLANTGIGNPMGNVSMFEYSKKDPSTPISITLNRYSPQQYDIVASHEIAHGVGHGIPNPEPPIEVQMKEQQFLRQKSDEVFIPNFEPGDYVFTGAGSQPTEAYANSRDLGKDLGVRFAQPYPGDEAVIRLLNSDAARNSIKSGIIKGFRMDNLQAVWRALNGTQWLLLPFVAGAAAATSQYKKGGKLKLSPRKYSRGGEAYPS